MYPHRRSAVAVLMGALLAVAACGAPAASRTPTSEPGEAGTAAAEAYCTEQGGQLVERIPNWNTNADPAQWLELAEPMTFCEFETVEGDSPTRISVDLVTLSSEKPTLAGIAYLSKVRPSQTENPGENPARHHCIVDLGGSATWGGGIGAGGWTDQSQPVFIVMDMCVFPDMSAIDEFGIWYYANDIVRGADLSTKFRYQPDGDLPAIWPPTR